MTCRCGTPASWWHMGRGYCTRCRPCEEPGCARLAPLGVCWDHDPATITLEAGLDVRIAVEHLATAARERAEQHGRAAARRVRTAIDQLAGAAA